MVVVLVTTDSTFWIQRVKLQDLTVDKQLKQSPKPKRSLVRVSTEGSTNVIDVLFGLL